MNLEAPLSTFAGLVGALVAVSFSIVLSLAVGTFEAATDCFLSMALASVFFLLLLTGKDSFIRSSVTCLVFPEVTSNPRSNLGGRFGTALLFPMAACFEDSDAELCYLSILISRRTPQPLIICNDRLFMTTHK